MVYLIDNENLVEYDFPRVDDAIIDSGKYEGAFPDFEINLQSIIEICYKVDRANRKVKGVRPIKNITPSEFFNSSYYEVGDVMIVYSFISISQKLIEVIFIINELIKAGVRVISVYEGFDSNEPESMNLINSLSFIEKYENINIEFNKRKHKVGIDKARSKGTRLGKKAYSVNDFPSFSLFYERWQKKEITKYEFAILLGVSRPTLNKLITEYREELI